MNLPLHVVYVMSRFPKLTETFVLYEMEALKKLGVQITVMPLRLEKESARHPEAAEWMKTVFFAPWSLQMLWTNLKWLVRHPVRYLGTLVRALYATFGSIKFLGGVIAYYPRAVCYADRIRALDVQHLHAHFASHPAMAAWIIHRLCGVPYSFTAHGTDLHVDQHMLKEKARDAAFAVTVSEYNRTFIADTCGPETAERFTVLHCGTDPDIFIPPEAPSTVDRRFSILCVASFRDVKGHPILLEACAELKRRGISFCCRLVGYGPREDEIRRKIKTLGLTEEVRIEGPQPRPQVLEMLGESDVVALTSIQVRSGSREGIPVSLMEGMACGLPVVASRISGIPELVEDGETGLLFEPGNALEAADALERLAADPMLRAQMGERAREQILESFHLRDNAGNLAARIQAHLICRPTLAP